MLLRNVVETISQTIGASGELVEVFVSDLVSPFAIVQVPTLAKGTITCRRTFISPSPQKETSK